MRNRWILALALAFLGGSSPAFSSVASSDLGRPAPALSVVKLNGEKFDLANEKGKPVMLIFFATWCEGCEKDLRAVSTVSRKYRKSGLEILALSIDRPRDRKKVDEFMRPFEVPAALLSDAGINGYGKPAVLPTIYVIDREGILRLEIQPSEKPLTDRALDEALAGLMKR